MKYNPHSQVLSYCEGQGSFPQKGLGKPSGRLAVGKGLIKAIILRGQKDFAGRTLKAVIWASHVKLLSVALTFGLLLVWDCHGDRLRICFECNSIL